jgi:hypothetical protein
MKDTWLLLILLFAMIMAFNNVFYDKGLADMGFDLTSFQWKNRVIIIFANSSTTESYLLQKGELESRTDGVLDRDLVVLELFENERSRLGDVFLPDDAVTNLKDHFDVEQGQFQFILIGKDGTVKLRSNNPVPAEDLFGLIDAMPMRQEEMRRKTK